MRRLERRPQRRPYFLFVGRLEKIKGLDDVIPLFAEDIGADLLITGDGEYAGRLKALGQGIESVRFLGRLEPESLARYYRHARALIVPSVCFETFGIVLIEAFREGTPVIARRVGPFPEIVNRAKAGVLFDGADDLLVAMARFVRDDAYREELSGAARHAFRSYWSESSVIPQYLALLARTAEKRGMQPILDVLERQH